MQVILKNFITLDKKEILEVFKWRNHTKVAQFMQTKTFNLKEHLAFLESLKTSSSKHYFLVYEGTNAIGVIDFIKTQHRNYEFGLYQNPNLRHKGKILMQEILHYGFSILKADRLLACVYKDNIKAIALYQNFGFILWKEKENMYYFTKNMGGGE